MQMGDKDAMWKLEDRFHSILNRMTSYGPLWYNLELRTLTTVRGKIQLGKFVLCWKWQFKFARLYHEKFCFV